MAELLVLVLGIVVVAGAFLEDGPGQLLKKFAKFALRTGLKITISAAKLGLNMIR